MKKQIEKIMNSIDPASQDLKQWDKNPDGDIRKLMIAPTIIGMIIAAVITYLVKTGNKYSVTLNAFGFICEVNADNFFVSPFMIFIYISIIAFVLIAVIEIVFLKAFINITIKTQTLNNTYRTMLLTQQIANALLPDDDDDEKINIASEEKSTVHNDSNGNVYVGKCEMCDKEAVIIRGCKINDHLGVRYRKLCESCIEKYNATIQ